MLGELEQWVEALLLLSLEVDYCLASKTDKKRPFCKHCFDGIAAPENILHYKLKYKYCKTDITKNKQSIYKYGFRQFHGQ